MDKTNKTNKSFKEKSCNYKILKFVLGFQCISIVLSEIKRDEKGLFLFACSPAKIFSCVNITPEIFQMSVVVDNRLMCTLH